MGNASSGGDAAESGSVEAMQTKVDEINRRVGKSLQGDESILFELSLPADAGKQWKKKIVCIVTLNGGKDRRSLDYAGFHRVFVFLKNTISKAGSQSESGSDVETTMRQLKHSDGVLMRTTSEEAFNDDAECCICLERRSDILLPVCMHSFCTVCITGWVEKNNARMSECPMCRCAIRSDKLIEESWTLLEDTPPLSFVWDEICKEASQTK